MLDISVIILTYNEEKHIRRCIENVISFAKEVFIIDSFSTDQTLKIAREYDKVQVLQNKWENNQAKQFNWGLEHATITTEWVLRLDADEYLTPELVAELQYKLPTLSMDITGVVFNRYHIFMGKSMKKIEYPVKLLRLFRYGKAICEYRLIDEHIQLLEGHMVDFKHDMIDENLNNLSWMCHKLVDYAIREAILLLNIEMDINEQVKKAENIGKQAHTKRWVKYKYVRMPLFWRAFFFFCYRYILKGGFWDGKIGFVYHFTYTWWYRTLVDAKILEIQKACGCDREQIRKYIRSNYNMDITFPTNENNNIKK